MNTLEIIQYHAALAHQGIIQYHAALAHQGIIQYFAALAHQGIIQYHAALAHQGIIQYFAALAHQGIILVTSTRNLAGTDHRCSRRLFHLYKVHNNLYFKAPFPPVRTHLFGTRSINVLNEIRCKSKCYTSSFYPDSIRYWNKIGP